jgi:hypothetical protein
VVVICSRAGRRERNGGVSLRPRLSHPFGAERLLNDDRRCAAYSRTGPARHLHLCDLSPHFLLKQSEGPRGQGSGLQPASPRHRLELSAPERLLSATANGRETDGADAVTAVRHASCRFPTLHGGANSSPLRLNHGAVRRGVRASARPAPAVAPFWRSSRDWKC